MSHENATTSVDRDYRDDLREMLSAYCQRNATTKYRICKQMGIDNGTLSNVLAKRRHFSLDKVQHLAKIIGYEMKFLPKAGQPQGIIGN